MKSRHCVVRLPNRGLTSETQRSTTTPPVAGPRSDTTTRSRAPPRRLSRKTVGMPLLPPDHIRQIKPYEPGKPVEEVERELGLSGTIKLASNENPLRSLSDGCESGA